MIDCTPIYKAYPRHMAPRDAMRAIEKAVTYLARSMGREMAFATLLDATQAYARSPSGRNPDRSKIPYPATWFNRQSYLEDPAEWQHVGGNNGVRENEYDAARRRIREEALAEREIDDDGGVEGSEAAFQ